MSPHTENRRRALKRMARTSAFIVPAVATFKLTELNVQASGLGGNPTGEQAWRNYWSRHRVFLRRRREFWENQRERWHRLYTYLQNRGWL